MLLFPTGCGSTRVRFLYAALAMLVTIMCAIVPARADWLNLTGAETSENIAEIQVLDDRVRVILEIGLPDLNIFSDLVPDDLLKTPIENRPSLDLRLDNFSQNIFQIIPTPDGKPLRATPRTIEPRLRKERISPYAGGINPMTRRPVPAQPADRRVLYAELDYMFTEQPDALKIIPPLDKDGSARATIGFIVFHKAVPVIDFRYLTAEAHLTLDWHNPWYSVFDNRNLTRHHRYALMGFLYVEPREIRQEVIMSVQDLREWIEWKHGDLRSADVAVQDEIKAQAATLLKSRNPVSIDGTVRAPTQVSAQFLNLSSQGVKIIDNDAAIDLDSAVIGIIASYPIERLPQKAELTWQLFNDRVKRIPTVTIDPAGPMTGTVERGDPLVLWQNFLRTYEEPQITPVNVGTTRAFPLPILSIFLAILGIGIALWSVSRGRRTQIAGGFVAVLGIAAAIAVANKTVIHIGNPFSGPPGENEAVRIVETTLTNVNTAFLEKDPEALKGVLSELIASGQFAGVTPELQRALSIKVAGGGVAQVRSIAGIKTSEISPLSGSDGFRTLGEWRALASASHFGHAHRREIQFRALMEFVPENSVWKLAGLTVLEARTGKP